VSWPAAARQLSDAFWPGALTIVVAVDPSLAQLVGGTSSTVGFRMPNDELLLEVLARTGPLVVSSANEHSKEPCHSVDDVVRTFSTSEQLGGVLDAGVRIGEVSTVVALEGATWRVVREGAIAHSEIARVLDSLN
jgi:L-threonylcarbamoyladenylate synthase